jgi:hypothetical protein
MSRSNLKTAIVSCLSPFLFASCKLVDVNFDPVLSESDANLSDSDPVLSESDAALIAKIKKEDELGFQFLMLGVQEYDYSNLMLSLVEKQREVERPLSYVLFSYPEGEMHYIYVEDSGLCHLIDVPAEDYSDLKAEMEMRRSSKDVLVASPNCDAGRVVRLYQAKLAASAREKQAPTCENQ